MRVAILALAFLLMVSEDGGLAPVVGYDCQQASERADGAVAVCTAGWVWQ